MYNKKSYAQSKGFIPAGMTTGDYLDQAVSLVPDKAAIIFNNNYITYRQLDNSVDQLAESLLHLGIRHGDRIALLLPDCPEFIIASQAILRIGAVKVPLHINFRESEIRFALLHSKARAIIMTSYIDNFSFADLIAHLRSQFPALEYVIVKGRTNSEMIPLRQLLTGDEKAKNLVEKYVHDHPVEPDDIAAIVYTSGTTGIPKGVVHTHNTICRLAYSSNHMREMQDNEVWLGMFPLSSASGVIYVEPCPIISRTTLVLLESYEPEFVLKSIQQYKVTSPVGLTAMFIKMLKYPYFFDYDVTSVRNICLGGAAISKDLLIDLQNKFKCTLTLTYGASEYGHATMTKLTDPLEIICKTSGKPIYGGVEVKIVNSNERIVPHGEVGEIFVRGFGNALGYLGAPDRTQSTFDDYGWVHVHDLGVMDEEGNITVVGRNNDMIVRGGYNIYPDEIESLLYAHPKVAEVNIVGYPDQKLGEKTCAFIVPEEKEITREEIVSFLNNKIAKYKIPDQVRVVASFPITTNGKVQKYKLREMLTREIKK